MTDLSFVGSGLFDFFSGQPFLACDFLTPGGKNTWGNGLFQENQMGLFTFGVLVHTGGFILPFSRPWTMTYTTFRWLKLSVEGHFFDDQHPPTKCQNSGGRRRWRSVFLSLRTGVNFVHCLLLQSVFGLPEAMFNECWFVFASWIGSGRVPEQACGEDLASSGSFEKGYECGPGKARAVGPLGKTRFEEAQCAALGRRFYHFFFNSPL